MKTWEKKEREGAKIKLAFSLSFWKPNISFWTPLSCFWSRLTRNREMVNKEGKPHHFNTSHLLLIYMWGWGAIKLVQLVKLIISVTFNEHFFSFERSCSPPQVSSGVYTRSFWREFVLELIVYVTPICQYWFSKKFPRCTEIRPSFGPCYLSNRKDLLLRCESRNRPLGSLVCWVLHGQTTTVMNSTSMLIALEEGWHLNV